MRTSAWAGAAVACALALLPGCGSAAHTTSPTTVATTAAPTTVATTSTTSTTVFSPPPRPGAVRRQPKTLFRAWQSGSRARAAAVATPAAAATLLAQPYPPAGVQFRSCGQQAPLTCTYRNLDTDGIYELAVVQTAGGGWYVQSVLVES